MYYFSELPRVLDGLPKLGLPKRDNWFESLTSHYVSHPLVTNSSWATFQLFGYRRILYGHIRNGKRPRIQGF